MKAEIIKGRSPGAARSILAEKIPLATPYIIQIFPAYACNFKCNYCIHSLKTSQRGYIADKKFLDFEVYKKCIDDILKFPEKVKMLRFAATGEPLLHPKIAEMIEYAAQRKVANSIEIVTNASLLTHNLTDELVNSGLNWLRVSIQGVTSEQYKKVTSVDVDLEKLVENLKYFYHNKKETKVYIKIIDSALNQGDEEQFYNIFGDICDKIAIEHLLPAVAGIDYSKITDKEFNFTQNGNEITEIEVCPQPFYMMQINPDGNVVPCCSMETAYIVDNCTQNSLFEIWNGQRYKNFQIQMLKFENFKNPVCNKCQIYKFGIFPEDILDRDAKKLIKLF